MGIKEAYKRLKDRELQYKEAAKASQEDYDMATCSFYNGELAAMKFDLKIIEEECPEVLEDNNGN